MMNIVPLNPMENRGALRRGEAAKYLGIGFSKLWELTKEGKIVRTSYGTYPVQSLNSHLRSEIEENREKEFSVS